MSMKRTIVCLVIGFFILSGGFLLYQRTVSAGNEAAAAPSPAGSTPDKTGTAVISAEGRLLPVQTADLAFAVQGQVAEILATEGSQVQTGEPILRLDTRQMALHVQETELALAQALATLAVAEAQIPVLQAGVTIAEWGVTAAQAQLDLLLAPPLPAEITAAEANVAAAQAGIAQMAGNRDASLNGNNEAQIRAAEAQVAAALANRDALQEGYDHLIANDILGAPEEEMRLRLQAAEAQVASAQAALDALQAGPTAVQSAVGNAGVGVAAAQRDAAEAQLALLQAPVSAARVQQAEEGVAQAQTAVSQAQTAVQQGQAAVAQAEAGVAQAQAAVEAAQAALARMTLLASFDGIVASLEVEAGEVVMPGTAVVTLADTTTWLVETSNLTELDVVGVTVGQPVDVHVDALPGQALPGTVIDVALASQVVQGDVLYTITIQLADGTHLPLRWGMTAFVDIAATGEQ